jgi:FlaA1/EpsC-like NDP-sugar epimerase
MKILKGMLMGSILISVFYAFIDESLRFSRALIIIGSIMAFIVFIFNRYLFHFVRYRNFSFQKELRIAVIGSQQETERVANLLNDSNLDCSFLGFIGIDDKNEHKKEPYLGNIDQLEEIIHIHKISELIFCSKDIPSHRIIHIMTKISHKDIIYKIAPEESLFVIGSNNKNEPGDFYTINIKLSIATPQNKLNKRILDISSSLLFLVTFILLMWFQQNISQFFGNMFRVLSGKKSMVGYESNNDELLPQIRPCVISCIPASKRSKLDEK